MKICQIEKDETNNNNYYCEQVKKERKKERNVSPTKVVSRVKKKYPNLDCLCALLIFIISFLR
jgi:hypothetical protein